MMDTTIVELPAGCGMHWAALHGQSGETYAEFLFSVDALAFAILLITGRVTDFHQGLT